MTIKPVRISRTYEPTFNWVRPLPMIPRIKTPATVAGHPRFALFGHRLPQEDGGDGVQHQSQRLRRIGRGDAACIHEARARRAETRNSKRGKTQRTHRHACEPRGLRVAADGIKPPPDDGLLEQDPRRPPRVRRQSG